MEKLSRKKVIAVDFGGTNIRAALAQSNGTLLHSVRVPTEAEAGQAAVLRRIKEAILEAAGDSWPEVTGIGMVAPGPLDPWEGVIIYSPNLHWHQVPIKQIFEDDLQRPVRIGNDANLAALAEHQFGAGQGLKHLIYITVSTGIGGGIIIDDRLLLGASGYGAEVGQIVVAVDGPPHASGVKGSVEAIASGPAIARLAQKRVKCSAKASAGQKLVTLAGGVEAITANHVGQASLEGDPLAVEIMQYAGKMVGVMLVSLLSLFNPEIVIIGGGVSGVGDLFFQPIQDTVRDNLHQVYWENCPIVPVTLGDDVGLLGGVALLNSVE